MVRVLYIPIECRNWQTARGVPYSAYLAFEEGFRANQVECYTVPAIWSSLEHNRDAWLNQLKQLCDGKVFDQIWVEAIHTHLDEPILELLSDLAPVRLAILQESLTYTPREMLLFGELERRQEIVESRLQYFTHAAVVDEHDSASLNDRKIIQAVWMPAMVPKRFVRRNSRRLTTKCGIFIGNPYGDRAQWLAEPTLAGKLLHVVSGENVTVYPRLFNQLNRAASAYSKTWFPPRCGCWAYLRLLRLIRRKCFRYYLDTLQSAGAIINLPHPGKTYSYRVVEAMAAGRPAISWRIPDRPKNEALFRDRQEILLFDQNDPGQLAACIDEVTQDPAFAARIATKAQEKLRRLHTTEVRIAQILRWMATGDQPDYG